MLPECSTVLLELYCSTWFCTVLLGYVLYCLGAVLYCYGVVLYVLGVILCCIKVSVIKWKEKSKGGTVFSKGKQG